MPPRGIEPREPDWEKVERELYYESEEARSSPLASLEFRETLTGLAKVVAAWPSLRSELKTAIDAIVDAGGGKGAP